MMTKNQLIKFEDSIVNLFESGKLPYPIHFCGGNENQLIKIFKNIKKGDWVFSTHRSHYHYLLKGGNPAILRQKILNGESICIMDKTLNFFSSAIVSGVVSIAVGVAQAFKMANRGKGRVYCFIGDGAEDEGHTCEAIRYADGWGLPCTFIIEDNDLSVDTIKKERFGKNKMEWFKCVKRYSYKRKYPHVQTGKLVPHYM